LVLLSLVSVTPLSHLPSLSAAGKQQALLYRFRSPKWGVPLTVRLCCVCVLSFMLDYSTENEKVLLRDLLGKIHQEGGATRSV
jgi:hypothetical protein